MKVLNVLECALLQRLQCSLHDPMGLTIAPGMQELAEGRRHVDRIELLRTRLNQLTELPLAAAV